MCISPSAPFYLCKYDINKHEMHMEVDSHDESKYDPEGIECLLFQYLGDTDQIDHFDTSDRESKVYLPT